MARVEESTKQAWRKTTVLVLLDMRAAYLRNGANALKHWDQILDRMRAAARQAGGVEEWHSAMLRSLQLGAEAVNNSASSTLVRLVDEVGAMRGEWLDLIEREHGLLIAMARLEAEQRKAARDNVTETLEG